ncbi:hypothetical protein CCACVL1_19834 [Corchorus capsularis]|uniref:Zinc finger, RING-type n=1 Tax=Corchorus capsularis TaxID=210143 RepID=A0A1R3HEJ4_COCAP|nr:hypothetical protein CCACVL1_19834 [Corchorus capsularis]
MDHPRSGSGNAEDNVGIPDDLRCKRSDGKQWRCTAMSMPDKTVCEKHYIQAKRRAANSALRASLKKKRKLGVEPEVQPDTKSDDFDVPLISRKVEDYPPPVSGKKSKEKAPKKQIQYSPETPPMRNLSARNSLKVEEDYQRDDSPFEENWRSYKTPSFSAADSSRNRSQRSYDDVAIAAVTPDDSEESSEEVFVGQTCHQCRRNDREKVSSCLKCDKRGYCDICISTWYSNIPVEEFEKACPACRGFCNCKACLRSDNMIKVRIREIPVLDKLQYHYSLLSSVLPVVKKIHQEQCFEVELERKLRGMEIDLPRTKVNADEQMCCNFCRIPIIDYHRHCANCSYDLCLRCCQDLRRASSGGVEEVGNEAGETTQDKETASGQASEMKPNFLDKFSGWEANSDGSIPCPPMEYGGCGHHSLNLNRIFKMNWVAKLVKNVEEMVSGCKVNDVESLEKIELNDPRLCQFADREGCDDNLLYCPSSQDIKAEGIADFRKHWGRGKPVIVKEVCDSSSISSWDPVAIWRGIQETSDEKMKDENRIVKALDCLDWSEVDIELGQFIEGYSEGCTRENGWPELLKLKDWPSPGASEEFLMYQRPEFISKLPLLEYIHSRLGLLNVAAKLPHYSLQNDVGPKIYISYGTNEELGRGDSVTNLHFKMRDMVYLLVHTCEAKVKRQKEKMDIQKSNGESEVNNSLADPEMSSDEKGLPDLSLDGPNINDEYESTSDKDEDEKMEDQGACWDIFRREDAQKLNEYVRMYWKDFGKTETVISDSVICPLYDESVYLNEHHKRKLREEFGVVPWSFEQHFGQAIFVPAGCPFQVRNLQVGKMSLYAASSAIKEVQKLVLDPKLSAELGFEDPNLTAAVSENLEVAKRRQITCA